MVSEYEDGIRTITEEMKAAFSRHISYRDSHKEVFPELLSWPPYDGTEASVCATLNYLKEIFNIHIESELAHINIDLVDAITNADANDWNTAADLGGEIQSKYNNHLVLNEIHNSVVVIKVEKDVDKILASLEYQVIPNGDDDRMSVFLDDQIT